ncbi:type II toxin-antitoxin system PemK/MazF family toxin [Paraconexibacter algicola]|uniref:Growth inhibitor PemK n=1 Tax=Paraconexibacter algicola TaxID=2133960 RepID=A0A2T4UG60_9ACTN|nr:type II toxin-antitoxin system PemK/MazF family toxin [Paraconexibacter algicola]PTL58242.1 growth inhibitor PemK [Paraconexibacter algicola]
MSEPAFRYDPDLDGDADPGEVVWTWVPYEEDASQGKDRPTVVIARDGDEVLLVPLSSRSHEDRPDRDDWIELGSGAWDRDGRRSHVDVSRVLRVRADAIRREGAVLEQDRFEAVVAAVRARGGG